jgi:hypothetical protein
MTRWPTSQIGFRIHGEERAHHEDGVLIDELDDAVDHEPEREKA